jgi:PhnB protein
MAKQSASEQLDKVVQTLLGPADAPLSRDGAAHPFDPSFAPVIEVIADLKSLPRADFKTRLKANLERRAVMATAAAREVSEFRASATPYLSIKGAAAAIEFYKKAFGAEEVMRLMQSDGRIGHAEISIAGARIMLADEFPEIGFRSPESLGGSPILISLGVEDVDAMAQRAISAGATVVRSVANQFYGTRSGQFRDPFGYTWVISTATETLSPDEMQRRNDELSRQQASSEQAKPTEERAPHLREGFHSITPYLIIDGAGKWIEFVKQAFGGEEKFRVGRPGAEDLIMHAEVKIGDSMIELADANPQYPAMPCTLLLRESDPDAAYNRAIEAGATVFEPVSDKEYGSRGGTVVDFAGNRLHISNPTGTGKEIFKDFRSVTPHLYARQPEDLIEFLKRAFAGKETYRAQMPDGSIPHAQVRIGDSVVALAGGRGPYTPMPSTLHLYVPDADATYKQALRAGATSIQPPADQPYGERSAGVTDPFGNRWFIATPLRRVES